jgi:hypothetical protein
MTGRACRLRGSCPGSPDRGLALRAGSPDRSVELAEIVMVGCYAAASG